MKPPRILLAAAVATACVVFVGAAVYVDFAGLRVRAVKEPIAAGPDGVRVPLNPTKLHGLAAPFALVANVRNDSPSAATITIRLDDREVCAAMVPAGRSIRADCQFAGPWDPEIDHLASLSSQSGSWELDALELSTHHGSNAAFIRAYVLPAASHAYRTPGMLACAVLWAALFALLLVRTPPLPRALRVAHRAVVALFALWAVAVVAASFVSSYKVIVSANTVAAWLLVCLSPQTYAVAREPVLVGVAWLLQRGPIPRAIVAAVLVVACFAIVVERRVAVEYDGNYSGLIALSRARVDAIPWLQERDDVKRGLIAPENAGYDGQFMYAIAFDPFILRFHSQTRAYQPFIDSPPYRYGRVGYPLITRIVALGRPERFPTAMVATIYSGIFLAAFALGWLAARSGSSPWWGLLIALVPGFWASFRGVLPEPVAAGAAIAGYFCVRERRFVAGALLLAAACLIRETSAFFVVCIAGWLAWTKQPREAVKVLVIALAPLCVWRLYVGHTFSPVWGFEAYFNPPDDFGPPFAGIAALWSDLAAGRYYPDSWEMRRGIMCYSILVIAGAGLSWTMVRVRPGAVTAAASVFAAMAICFNLRNVWVGTGNAERLTGDLFACLALVTPEFVSRSRTWRATLITFWVAVAAYLLFGTFDAAFTRQSFVAALPWS